MWHPKQIYNINKEEDIWYILSFQKNMKSMPQDQYYNKYVFGWSKEIAQFEFIKNDTIQELWGIYIYKYTNNYDRNYLWTKNSTSHGRMTRFIGVK